MKLILEGRPDIRDVTNDDVLEAIEAMASPHGPTFVILEDDQRNYTQAAGTDGRYVIESRDVYGEGFTHWRAMRDGAGEGAATIRYRQRCPKGKHPPRGCPLKVRAGEVFSLRDVETVLLEFLSSASRTEALRWRDASADFGAAASDDDEIRDIMPGRHL